jgi:DNA-binding IclR family transcriptional regulator
MQSRTPRSVVNPKAIRSQLAEIRATGVSVSEEQTELGVGAIATPVFNSTGGVVASLAISGPLVRWSSIYSAASVGALLAAALNASQLLGFKGELPWQHQLADGPARPGRTPEWFVGKDDVDGP